jgi:predicted phosphodiesterase
LIALVSDVHGNWPALQAVLRELDAAGCATIVSLGDVAGYYPQLNECARELERRAAVNVLGNHDHYLLSGEDCPRSRSATACIRHQRQLATPACRAYLSRSKPFVRLHGIAMVHGGWNDPLDEYLVDVDESHFKGLPGRMFASGHTHLPLVKRWADRTYVNPGSVGQPRDGDPRAAYALVDGERVELRRVAYDIDAAAAAMRAAGIAERFYSNLDVGRRIGQGHASW